MLQGLGSAGSSGNTPNVGDVYATETDPALSGTFTYARKDVLDSQGRTTKYIAA